MPMAYDVKTYIGVGSVTELEKRFRLLEPLVHIQNKRKSEILRIQVDHEFAKQLIEECDKCLADLRQDMENIITAIEVMSVR